MEKRKRVLRRFNKSVKDIKHGHLNKAKKLPINKINSVKGLEEIMEHRFMVLNEFIRNSRILRRHHLSVVLPINTKGMVYRGNLKNVWMVFHKDRSMFYNGTLREVLLKDKKLCKEFPEWEK